MIGFKKYLSEQITFAQLKQVEKFADRLLDKFDVDVKFSKHFADRLNDERNHPAINMQELIDFFRKIEKKKAQRIKQNVNHEVVLKDIQSDLNLPVVIKMDRSKGEFVVVNKTIIRKKNFLTRNKVLRY